MIKKLGGMSSMLSMIPGISKLTNKMGDVGVGDKILVHQEAIVLSMTKKERKKSSLYTFLNATLRTKKLNKIKLLLRRQTQFCF